MGGIDRFTRCDPTVTVRVGTDNDTASVYIVDNGPSVPDDPKDASVGASGGMSSEGTGIGLYPVRTLVDQYGGRL